MLRIVLRLIVPSLISTMDKIEFKNRLILAINKNIDIPVLNEETEGGIYDALYETFIQLLLVI